MRQKGKSKIIEPRNIIGFKSTGGGSTVSTSEVNTYQDRYVIADYVETSNSDLNGTETIDGSSPSDNDVILVTGQSTASENGLYSYNSSGDWSRITGLKPSYLIIVKSGSTYSDTIWIVTSDSFTEGTDSINIEEYNFDSSYLLRSANDFNGFTSVTPDGADVVLIEDANDSFNKKKITISDISSLGGHWDTEFTLSSDDSITASTTETTFSGSSVTLGAGKYEIEVTLIGYADSGSPQAYPEFGFPFTGTLSGNLDNILKFSDSSNYTLGNLAFDQITELAENYYQYKGIFEVTGSGDLTMTFRATVVSAATVYAVAGTGYKLRQIV